MRQLAHEFAPHVRVNAVSPGATYTDKRMPAAFGVDEKGQRVRTQTHPSNIDEAVERVTPLRMHARPPIHAGAYVLLASRRDNQAMTGTVIRSEAGLGVPRPAPRSRRRRSEAARSRFCGVMKILLTGNRGRLGPSIERRLLQDGHEVRGFDLATGGNIVDAGAVKEAAAGVDAIVHVAGVAGDRGRPAAEILAVNLTGTANVLVAAEEQGVPRVVYMSSGRALGLLERDPDYLPLDDEHRGLPSAPYALSKWLAEEMCEAFTNRTGVTTICLRPVRFSTRRITRALAKPVAPPRAGTFWPLGVPIDVRDVATAVAAAVRCGAPAHSRLLLCAADIASGRPTMDLVAERVPEVRWNGDEGYRTDPSRSLIDTTRRNACSVSSVHTWPGRWLRCASTPKIREGVRSGCIGGGRRSWVGAIFS